MKLFDLHCDTLGEIFRRGEGILNNSCHVSLEKALSVFDEYIQVMAVWSEHDVDCDENYRRCLSALTYGKERFTGIGGFTPIYAVEGGKLLNGDISRLDALYDNGVKIFTLVWKEHCCIGGAYDNRDGLTSFGFEVLERCFDLGIVPDLSHSNGEINEQALALAKSKKKPVIASHSCSRAVFDHPRNISDTHARAIAENGGVIGVNLVSDHLGGRSMDILLSHIDNMVRICGEGAVCMGGDLDGTADETLPEGVKNIGDMPLIHSAISQKYHSERMAEAIFYTNARNFAKDYLFTKI